MLPGSSTYRQIGSECVWKSRKSLRHFEFQVVTRWSPQPQQYGQRDFLRNQMTTYKTGQKTVCVMSGDVRGQTICITIQSIDHCKWRLDISFIDAYTF
jgi:hypothetical protein